MRGVSGDSGSGRTSSGATVWKPASMHTRCVVNAVRRGGARAPLLCGASGCTACHGRWEALEAVVQAGPGLRIAAVGLGGRLDEGEEGRLRGLCYPWSQDTLGIAGSIDDVSLEDIKQRFITVVKVQPGLVTAHAKLFTHVLGLSIAPWESIGRTDNRRRRTRS